MTTFLHSGTAGDTVYSLAAVKKMGGGEFQIGIQNLERILPTYGYRAEDCDPAHRGRYTEQDYSLLAPLIERQSYVTKVSAWRAGDANPDVNLDQYRSVLYRSFEGNIVESYFRTFNLPFTLADVTEPWLEADAICETAIIVNSTPRYRTPDPETDAQWATMCADANLAQNGLFVGTPAEHEAFVAKYNCSIKYRPVKDFLELAGLIAGADLFLGNQSMSLSIAMGLGKTSVVELHKMKPMQYRECYFPRDNITYF
jgi:hypothetical protein